MAVSTKKLEAELNEEKQRLRDTIEELGDVARSAVSWRTQFNEHPLAIMAAAAALGAAAGMIAGGRGHNAEDDDEAPRSRRDRGTRRRPRRRSSVVSHVMTLVAGRLVQVAEDVVRERIARRLEGRRGQRPSMPSENTD